MSINPEHLTSLIQDELKTVSDKRLLDFITPLLVTPKPILRKWHYGKEGEQYTCWTVLEYPSTNIGIAYCEQGFGPRTPWGMVIIKGEHLSIGMDCDWHTGFLQIFFESLIVTPLPIWRVFEKVPSGPPRPITKESGWNETWELVKDRRRKNPQLRYDCDHSIQYGQK